MSFEEELKKRVCFANEVIEAFLPKEENVPGSLIDAMKYSVLAGGKRIRPVLMAECYRLYGGKSDDIKPFMAAMETIHTSSLVHDDLPAIDDDMLRRGKKTTHAYFGEAMGVLSGDALLNYAYELLFKAAAEAENTKNALKAAQIIAVRSGYRGMLGGQAVDVEHEKTGIEGDKLEILDYIYKYKTAALFSASMMAGAALAGANDESLEQLEKAAILVGVAFQIMDDVIDVTGTTETIGKPVFSDEKNEKDTYVSLTSVDEALKKAGKMTEKALEVVKEIPGDTEFLRELLIKLASRKK